MTIHESNDHSFSTSCLRRDCGACGTADADVAVASLNVPEVTETPDSDPGLIPGEEAVLAFTACLRDEELDIGDPDVDGDGNLLAPSTHAVAGRTLDMAAVHSAFDVCQGFLDVVAFGFSVEDLSEREDELLAFAVCMRENGYDMPDPDFSGDGHSGDGPLGDAIDTDDPEFKKAVPSCEGIVGG